jgi:hypothetical protein
MVIAVIQDLERGGTLDVREFTGWSKDLRVTADGTGVVGMVGVVGLRMLADRTGLTAGVSKCWPGPGFIRCMTGAGC